MKHMRLKVAYNYWRHTIHFSGGGVVQQRPLIHCHPPYPFMRADFYKMKDRQRTPMVYVYLFFKQFHDFDVCFSDLYAVLWPMGIVFVILLVKDYYTRGFSEQFLIIHGLCKAYQ